MVRNLEMTSMARVQSPFSDVDRETRAKPLEVLEYSSRTTIYFDAKATRAPFKEQEHINLTDVELN